MRTFAGGLIVFLLGLVLTVAGCTPAEKGPGTIDLMVISNILEEGMSGNQAGIEISNIEMTVSEIKVYRGGVVQDEESEQEEWLDLYVTSEPLNLLQKLGREQFLAFADVPATSYDQIVMLIERLDVTLSNGEEMLISVTEPYDFTASFVVYSEKTTTIIFKLSVDKSVTFTNENQAIIKPLAGITLTVRYEDME